MERETKTNFWIMWKLFLPMWDRQASKIITGAKEKGSFPIIHVIVKSVKSQRMAYAQ